MKVKEEMEPATRGARSERQDWRALRRLDAEIAQRVFGWTRYPEAMHPTDNRTIEGVLYCPPKMPWDCSALNVVPHYSTDIADAMKTVVELCAKGFSFACTIYQGRLPYASFRKRTAASSRNAEAPTLPEAICRAALSLVDPPTTDEVE